MRGGRDRDAARVALVVLMVIVPALVAAAVAHLVTGGPIGPDAAAPVIAFDRLVAGQRLEGPLWQTSKPLLTLVYGVVHGLLDDWRAVSAVAILSFAAFVAIASLLAARIARSAVAGAFVFVGLTLLPALLTDVVFAYGVSWAMLACAIAAAAVLGDRPRYAIAGIALAAGALARPEILAVTAFALLATLVAWIGARVRHRPGPPRGAWLTALGLVAIPVLMVHDGALAGDPLLWANIAQENSAGHDGARSFAAVTALVARHALSMAPLLPLVLLSVVHLLARRRAVELVIVTIVPVAVASFFILSGTRGTVIAVRYLVPIDVALVFAAGVGLGALDVPAVRARLATTHWLPAPSRTLPVLGLIVGAGLALSLAPSWPRDAKARSVVRTQVALQANATRAFGELRTLFTAPAWRGVPVPADARTQVLLPGPLRARGVVDLDLPLWAVEKLRPELIDPARGLPAPGTVIYHNRLADSAAKEWSTIEVSEPTTTAKLRVVPLFVDEDAGIWIVRVEAADDQPG